MTVQLPCTATVDARCTIIAAVETLWSPHRYCEQVLDFFFLNPAFPGAKQNHDERN
jgi:hypothetical protein